MPAAAVAAAAAAVDDEDGVQWRWWGDVQWRRQHSTATAMDYE
jgi:hypothetical protein